MIEGEQTTQADASTPPATEADAPTTPVPAEAAAEASSVEAKPEATADSTPEASPPAPEQPAEAEKAGTESDEPIVQPGMSWFALRVASNKESSVRDTLLRKVQIEHKTEFVGRILVPTEKSRTFKNGKVKISETKLYPGYVFVEMKLEDDGRIPQDVFFLIKETTGVGDFVGTPRPTPLELHEIEKIQLSSRAPEEEPEVRMNFVKGEHVTIKEGPFEGYEGSVDELLPDKGLVRVLVTIFGRQAPIEIEEWKLGKADES
ncbi:MAG: transcription termination/antitermination protein NusG [Phycisphaera sp.]|nr:MAG: transcription termination/antitermination protein NusG [Phycisphaera sp.]